jgi:hypothetical protein
VVYDFAHGVIPISGRSEVLTKGNVEYLLQKLHFIGSSKQISDLPGKAATFQTGVWLNQLAVHFRGCEPKVEALKFHELHVAFKAALFYVSPSLALSREDVGSKCPHERHTHSTDEPD